MLTLRKWKDHEGKPGFDIDGRRNGVQVDPKPNGFDLTNIGTGDDLEFAATAEEAVAEIARFLSAEERRKVTKQEVQELWNRATVS